MLVKTLFIAAIFSIAYSNDTFLESVRSESGLSLGSLLGGDVKLVAYDGKRCTGNEIGTISCDGQSCLDYKKAKSMMVKIIQTRIISLIFRLLERSIDNIW
jgi:hypothetical protein